MTSHPEEPRIFALVVAVDKYTCKDPNFRNLTGCRNDGMRFIQYLTDIHHVPSSRIVFLVDEQATESVILAEFRRFLIDNVDIQRDDPIVFFFAGHGRRFPAPEGWVTESGKIEVLCPHDIQTIGDDGKEVWGIPDRTINGMMHELASKKGNNIIAVFDCCFSGGLSRGKKETLRTRALPEYPHSPPVDLHQDIVSFSRSAKTVAQSGFQYKAMESHILLAACRPDEVARENPSAEDGPGGLFTSALIKALRVHSIHDTNYATLFEKLDLNVNQHPQCEGTNKNRMLFSVNALREGKLMFKVYQTNGKLCVYAGSIQGISEDTIFTVVSESETFDLKASKVRPFATVLEDTHHSIADDARAYISSNPNPTLRIHSSVPFTDLTRVTVVPAETCADIALRRNGFKWEMERFNRLMATYSDPVIHFDATEEQIPDIVDAVAHFHSWLYRSGDGAVSAFSGKVKTRLERLRMENGMSGPDGNDLLLGRASHAGINVQTAVIPATDADYCLTFENHSDVKLFLYLFHFNPSNYEIEIWYHPQGETTTALLSECKEDGPSVFPFGYGGFGTNAIHFELAEGQDVESVFVKVFLTTAYVDLSHVAQAGIDAVGGSRSNGSFRHAWASETFVLTCVRS